MTSYSGLDMLDVVLLMKRSLQYQEKLLLITMRFAPDSSKRNKENNHDEHPID
jgi:hypothetical protein